MPEDPMGKIRLPAAQISLASDLVDKLGAHATAYAKALWSVAQRRDADADEMAVLIRCVNQHFGVSLPEVVVDRWREIFRNCGGLVTIISEEHLLAGAPSDADALEPPPGFGDPNGN